MPVMLNALLVCVFTPTSGHVAGYVDVVAHAGRPYLSETAGTLMTLTLGNT